jgi:hypothetical protein
MTSVRSVEATSGLGDSSAGDASLPYSTIEWRAAEKKMEPCCRCPIHLTTLKYVLLHVKLLICRGRSGPIFLGIFLGLKDLVHKSGWIFGSYLVKNPG